MKFIKVFFKFLFRYTFCPKDKPQTIDKFGLKLLNRLCRPTGITWISYVFMGQTNHMDYLTGLSEEKSPAPFSAMICSLSFAELVRNIEVY